MRWGDRKKTWSCNCSSSLGQRSLDRGQRQPSEFSNQTLCLKEDGDSRKEAKDRTYTALGAATQNHKESGQSVSGRGGLSHCSPALVSISICTRTEWLLSSTGWTIKSNTFTTEVCIQSDSAMGVFLAVTEKCASVHVRCGAFYSSQDMEATSVSIDRCGACIQWNITQPLKRTK